MYIVYVTVVKIGGKADNNNADIEHEDYFVTML